jgi:uncharacterized delta-60 repeat protein
MPNKAGSLDTSFGNGGKVTTGFNGGSDEAYSVVLTSDNKIIVGGVVATGSDSNNYNDDFALAKYTADGGLDTSFGNNGLVTTDFNGRFDNAFSVVLTSCDKIIVGGVVKTGPDSDNFDFALAQYNIDGSLDTTFGTGGKVTTDFNGGDDIAYSVVLTSDDKIIVGGYASTDSNSNNRDFALAKYNVNGGLDPSFGTGGKVTTDFNGGSDEAYSVVLTSDDKIIVGGYAVDTNTGYRDFALARYSADGGLDPSFGTGGKVTTDFNGGSDEAYSVVLTSDDKIIVGGYAESFLTINFALAKYNNDGSLDTNFGSNGKVTTDFSGSIQDIARSVVLTSDDKIIVGGFTIDINNSFYFSLARYFNFTEPEPIVVLKEYIDSKVALIARYILSLEQKYK